MYACVIKQRRAIVETTPIVNAKLDCDWSALNANNSFKKFSKKNVKNTVSSVCQALFIHQIFRSSCSSPCIGVKGVYGCVWVSGCQRVFMGVYGCL